MNTALYVLGFGIAIASVVFIGGLFRSGAEYERGYKAGVAAALRERAFNAMLADYLAKAEKESL